jgi:hypothetical protein
MRSFGRPLKADTVTGDVSSRPRKARDEAAADRIGKEPENDGNGARLLQQLRSGGRALRKNEVRLQRDEFLGELLHQFLVERRPAIDDPNVAPLQCSPAYRASHSGGRAGDRATSLMIGMAPSLILRVISSAMPAFALP